jgi:Subtilase family
MFALKSIIAFCTYASRGCTTAEGRRPEPISDRAQYDGTLYNDPDGVWDEPQAFYTLRKTWKDRLLYAAGDKRLKIAILDTGIDMKGTDANCHIHEDFRQKRAISFRDGMPCPDTEGTPQYQRIKGMRNFCSGGEAEVQDLDGHGTAVAGIILRLAPETHLYIARICDGDINHGLAKDKRLPVGEDQIVDPRPDIIKKAGITIFPTPSINF